MKNKKITIIFIIVVIIVAILAGTYKIMISYIFKSKETEKTEINDGREELVTKLKSIGDKNEKEDKVKFFLETNDITEEEAKQILEK